MRGKKRGQQNIVVADFTEIEIVDEHGDKTGEKRKVFTVRKTFEGSVSTYETPPTKIIVGVVDDYERIITTYSEANINVGDYLFVDVAPVIVDNVITNKADYIVVRPITTQKGLVFRYGIKKICE